MQKGDILPPLELMARREDWSNGVSVYMRQRTVGFGEKWAAPVTMVEHDPRASVGKPMLWLEIQQAQQLMDELWQCGLRPSEGTGSAGSLAATERHLKDMRGIVKGLLRKNGVEVSE
ncbi:MAG: hypothetical protein RBS34_00405 [Desulfofustis sp.]|jgi:hypothetical protein|nr:hypothetical protein [Desulfofustis sp.]